jgi:deoxyribonuclease-4
MLVGCHVSIAGSIDRAVDRALERGCSTFQIFSRNPRGWQAKPLDDTAAAAFRKKTKDAGIDQVFVHMPYLPNLASPDREIYERSVDTLRSELERCEALAVPSLITHTGSHLGTGHEAGMDRLVDAIDTALASADSKAMLLLENTAGASNSIGGRLEEIGEVIRRVGDRDRIGVCFDTCHAFAAGYDLSTGAGLESTLALFEKEIGFNRLAAVHLNDSKGECGSRLDRHEHIGLGAIGNDGFVRILHDARIRRLPLICETPVDERCDDAGNIKKVLELAGAQIRSGPPSQEHGHGSEHNQRTNAAKDC